MANGRTSPALALIALGACRSPAVAPTSSPGADAVHVSEARPPASAMTLGEIVGQDGDGCGMFGKKGSREGAEADVRKQTAAMGGDYAEITKVIAPLRTMDCIENRWGVHAVAYRTMDAAPIAPQAVAPPTACTPICSPGYACNAGACFAQCDPACGSGSVCRQDRVCVPAP